MAQNVQKVSTMQGDWMAREPDGWRVKVPTQGGHQFFRIAEHGSSSKAYEAARKFQVKAYKQYLEDMEYKRKNGELPRRETMNIRNRSGIRGVSRQVFPNLGCPPRIVYKVTWMETHGGMRIQASRDFNVDHYTNEAVCRQEAINHRQKMVDKHGLEY